MDDHTPEEHTDDVSREDADVDVAERPDLPDLSRPRTVGEMLAAERRRQGKSVGDVAEATNIRARMVEALEAGAYDHLPDSAYVRGYVQNYATFLGRSPEPFLEAYRHELPDNDPVAEQSAGMGGPILPRRDQAHAIPARLLVGVVVFFAAVGLIWLTLSLVGGSDTEPAPLPPVEEETPASDVATDAPPGVTGEEADAAPEEETVAVQPVEMTVTVDDADASWLRITVDGERVYEGTLDGGESRTYEISDLATVLIGRPSVVTITRDGQPVEIPNTGELPTVEIVADE